MIVTMRQSIYQWRSRSQFTFGEIYMNLYPLLRLSTICLAILSAHANAAVNESEAQKLGKELTPIGAEQAANADGSIPAWQGGLQEQPSGYVNGGFLHDPFPEDQPLFSITSENLSEYAANLSPGQVAMLERYPDFKMNVYPTRRTAAYPDAVYEAARKNATVVETTDNGNGITPFSLSVPFPIPNNAQEVIWNHLTRYRSAAVERDIVQIPVQTNGKFIVNRFVDTMAFPQAKTDFYSEDKDNNILIYFLQVMKSPARETGNVLLVHETIDQVSEPRRAWRYNAGQRRVRRAPQVAYDSPGGGSDGLRTTDDYDMYNGAPDRYNWALVGKQELYIPYNSYKLHSPDLSYADIHKPNHLNPDALRYEKHRVWVVEATLKEGARHIYAKRTFYIDEDTWQASVIDQYDGRGELWKLAEAHHIQYYNVDVPWYTAESRYDLLSGRYVTMGLSNEAKKPFDFDFEPKRKMFTPSGLRRVGVK